MLDLSKLNVVFEMANNHQGDVDHALHIVHEVSKLVEKYAVDGVIKWQFRHLPTFVRDDIDPETNSHVGRFESTALMMNDFELLFAECRHRNLKVMVTPFDEISVDHAIDLGVDFLKVASCSAEDWPLLEKIKQAGKPVIFSTGGLGLDAVRKLVSFFTHADLPWIAMMHCVSLYPMASEDSGLDLMDLYSREFPGLPIGWSTHENPDDFIPAVVAASKGCMLFEKHIGSAGSKGYALNRYSLEVTEAGDWIGAILAAKKACDVSDFNLVREKEVPELEKLQRTSICKYAKKKGDLITPDDCEFRFPLGEGEVPPSVFSSHNKVTATEDIAPGDVLTNHMISIEKKNSYFLSEVIRRYKALLNLSNTSLPQDFVLEISHHEGIEKAHQVGAALITIVNDDYCKKVLIMLPGQFHPSHHHPIKSETFFVVWGDLRVQLNGESYELIPGSLLKVPSGALHSFTTVNGCVFEEISTKALVGDSKYQESNISAKRLEDRKSWFKGWGRFQLDAID